MCCIGEVFQTAVVGHVNLNNILKLEESNCSAHLLELVEFHKFLYWQHKLTFKIFHPVSNLQIDIMCVLIDLIITLCET
jgi:hypothetical protein